MPNFELMIITGTSGTGKSVVVNALEDIGFYCVDNMPPALISKFAEICRSTQGEISRIAVVTDMRGGHFFSGISKELQTLKELEIPFKILFVDADDNVLKTRYKESRRRHPMAVEGNLSIDEAIAIEREALGELYARADYIIDTTHRSPQQTRQMVNTLFLDNQNSALLVNCISFGFKYGLPAEADLVFDVRCFPNPFYVPELKKKTGLDAPVADYIFESEDTRTFVSKLNDMIDFLLPLYVSEGKSQLVVAIGCTGGKHRSVAIAQQLYSHLTQNGHRSAVHHRDIRKV